VIGLLTLVPWAPVVVVAVYPLTSVVPIGGVKLIVTEDPVALTTARFVGVWGPVLNDFDINDEKDPTVDNIVTPYIFMYLIKKSFYTIY
jgi:hypothetical protein